MIADQSSLLYPPGMPAEAFCGWLRRILESNHLVFCRFVETCPLQKELLVEGSPTRQVLGSGFNCVVAVDAKKGINWRGQFQLARFHRHVFAQLVKAFGFGRPGTYHEEDIVQFLRDEPSSLICLLNVHFVPQEDLGSLRSLVQEKHQAVVLYKCVASPTNGGTDSPWAEELERRLSRSPAGSEPQVEKPEADSSLERGLRESWGRSPRIDAVVRDGGRERGQGRDDELTILDSDEEPTNPDSVRRLVDAAFAALRAGDKDGARQHLLAAKQIAPGRRDLDVFLKKLEREA